MSKNPYPTRMCSGCMTRRPKSELIRIVRQKDGKAIVDTTGKMDGRGAYVCRRVECLKRARRAKRIEASLECSVPDEVYAEMENEIAGNPT